MQDRNDIVVFGNYRNAIEANIIKSKLDAYGIPCYLTDENLANLYPGASSLMNSQVRLHLFRDDSERARQILSENSLRVDDESVMHCPACQSTNVDRDFPRKLTLNLRSSLQYLFFGIFFPGRKVYRCGDCECEF